MVPPEKVSLREAGKRQHRKAVRTMEMEGPVDLPTEVREAIVDSVQE
jgi:hypothetical protein